MKTIPQEIKDKIAARFKELMDKGEYPSSFELALQAASIALDALPQWVSVKERLPEDFDAQGYTKHYLVYIDNPYFHEGNYWVVRMQRFRYGDDTDYLYSWCGIEPNVHHGNGRPNVTHWREVPLLDLPTPPHA